MHAHKLLLISLFLLSACSQETPETQKSSLPTVPAASVDVSLQPPVQTLADLPIYPDHPWLATQSASVQVNDFVLQDLEIAKELAKHIDLKEVSQRLLSIQSPITALGIQYPDRAYSVLNIPAVDPRSYPSPEPFQIHKRVLLGQTVLGFPLHLDLRVFHCSEESVDTVIAWHIDSLSGGDEQFMHFLSEDWEILIGRGDRNTEHSDPSHGLATKDRGVFLAYRYSDGALYVLCCDSSWPDLERQITDLQSLFRIPWARI